MLIRKQSKDTVYNGEVFKDFYFERIGEDATVYRINATFIVGDDFVELGRYETRQKAELYLKLMMEALEQKGFYTMPE